MRSVKVSSEINLPISQVWKLLTDINLYPKYVKFVKQVYIGDELLVGTVWYDKTTIMFLPLKIRHKVENLVEEKLLTFSVDTPFGGKMLQNFVLEPIPSGTKVTGEVTFDLGGKLPEVLLASFLEKRLKDMLETTLERVKTEVR